MAATGDGSLKDSCSEMDQNDISNILSDSAAAELYDTLKAVLDVPSNQDTSFEVSGLFAAQKSIVSHSQPEAGLASCSNHNTGEACHSYAEQPDFTAQVPTPSPKEKVLVVSLPSEMAELASNSNHNAGEASDPSAQQPDLSSEQKVLVCNSTLEMEVLASSSCQDLSETPGPSVEAADLPTIQPRKRKRQPENWRKNVSKKKRESGQPFINYKGEQKDGRKIKDIDCTSCKFKCSQKFTQESRKKMFEKFWSLSDNAKASFYSKFTERGLKERVRPVSGTKSSTRHYSYKFFLEYEGQRHRVCKNFFLQTLDISQRRVSYFHENLVDSDTGAPLERKKGKYIKKVTSDTDIEKVKGHIASFPTTESHYRRQQTKKHYLEKSLNISIMYDLYKEQCEQNGVTPVKLHKYRDIFNTSFNIGFVAPKSDRCDRCEEVKVAKENGKILSEIESEIHHKHIFLKNDAYVERQKDRASGQAVLCFDLQNVIQLPRSNVSNFYYKRKLSVYNLTVHSSVDKTVYCCLWNEKEGGRGGNDIAGALVRVLSDFVEQHSEIKEICLWSDSCVPQNRNSILTYALKSFIMTHKHIDVIVQKYSESGHSQIQEVDNAHSIIEKALDRCEVYSPISLMRVLKNVRKKPSIKIIQMKKDNFKDFEKESKLFNFSKVPYSSVKQLMINKEKPLFVSYKYCHDREKEHSVVSIIKTNSRSKKPQAFQIKPLYQLSALITKKSLPKDKVTDLKSMYCYMPAIDKDFFTALIGE